MAFTEELKQAILLSAMSGKLTEQNNKSENAQCIIDSIQERTIQSSKPLKTNPSITSEELSFDIPENWRWVRLSELAESLSDGIHGTPIYDDTGEYFFINGNNLVNGKIVIKNDTQRVCESEYLKYKKPLTNNTVLLSINGTIGNTAYYENEPVILGKSACYIALHPEINKEYFRLILSTRFFLMYGATKATQTTIKNLSLKAMRLFPVPLPPIEEQQRIVDRVKLLIEKLDGFSKIEQQLITLKANFPADMRGAILQAAMQGKLTEQLKTDSSVDNTLAYLKQIKDGLIAGKKIKPVKLCSGEDEPHFSIPDNWAWIKLTDIGELSRGKSKHRPRNDAILYIDGTIPLIQTGDVASANKHITKFSTCYNEVGLVQSRLWRKGTICITIAANIGDVAILDFDACFPDSVLGFLAYSENVSIEYVYFMLLAYKNHMNSKASKVAQSNLSLDKINTMLFPFPPIEEQQRIVERLDALLPLCDTLIE